MEQETVRMLIQVLGALTNHTQEYWLKITAMERVLDSHPEVKAEFDYQVGRLENDPAVRTNREASEAALDTLRARLLRD
jgi:hypothetical protein